MKRPTFKEATDVLELSGRELAELFGVPPQDIKQARLEPGSGGYRAAPEGWEHVVARLARRRGLELVRLADALEGRAAKRVKLDEALGGV